MITVAAKQRLSPNDAEAFHVKVNSSFKKKRKIQMTPLKTKNFLLSGFLAARAEEKKRASDHLELE